MCVKEWINKGELITVHEEKLISVHELNVWGEVVNVHEGELISLHDGS